MIIKFQSRLTKWDAINPKPKNQGITIFIIFVMLRIFEKWYFDEGPDRVSNEKSVNDEEVIDEIIICLDSQKTLPLPRAGPRQKTGSKPKQWNEKGKRQ